MTTKKSSQKTSAPPTVLVITLNADGSGSLLARRGELAHLSQFHYAGLQEIIDAIQVGATQLVDVEANPPPLNASSPEAESPTDETEVDDTSINDTEADAPVPAEIVLADAPSVTATPDLIGVTAAPNNPQPKLF